MNIDAPIISLDEAKQRYEQGTLTGVFTNTNEDYHAGPGVSKSQLDTLQKSPAHYYTAYLDPDQQPRKSTAAFDLGAVVHTLILEPNNQDYVVAPIIDRRTKAGKAAWAEFLAANEEKTHITQEQFDAARYMRDSVMSHPLASELLTDGIPEKSFYWHDPATGLLCRVRPDYLRSDVIVDLKTTEDGSANGFAKSVANYRYFVQDSMYCEGVRETTQGQIAPEQMIFLSVEKKPPYLVNHIVLDADARAFGRKAVHDSLTTLKACQENNHWPGYGEDIKEIALPSWYVRQEAKKTETLQWENPGQEKQSQSELPDTAELEIDTSFSF